MRHPIGKQNRLNYIQVVLCHCNCGACMSCVHVLSCCGAGSRGVILYLAGGVHAAGAAAPAMAAVTHIITPSRPQSCALCPAWLASAHHPGASHEGEGAVTYSYSLGDTSGCVIEVCPSVWGAGRNFAQRQPLSISTLCIGFNSCRCPAFWCSAWHLHLKHPPQQR